MFLSIDEKWLEENKEKGLKENLELSGEKEHKENPALSFPNIDLEIDDIYLDKGEIHACLIDKNGFYLSIELPLKEIQQSVFAYIVKTLEDGNQTRKELLKALKVDIEDSDKNENGQD